ncbi:unnamed protein product [Closterium sp. NIES-54]
MGHGMAAEMCLSQLPCVFMMSKANIVPPCITSVSLLFPPCPFSPLLLPFSLSSPQARMGHGSGDVSRTTAHVLPTCAAPRSVSLLFPAPSPPFLPSPPRHAWDMAAEMCLAQLPTLLADPNAEFQASSFKNLLTSYRTQHTRLFYCDDLALCCCMDGVLFTVLCSTHRGSSKR